MFNEEELTIVAELTGLWGMGGVGVLCWERGVAWNFIDKEIIISALVAHQCTRGKMIFNFRTHAEQRKSARLLCFKVQLVVGRYAKRSRT